ncbi:MAG: SusD/RagB family nutrient-binding outer membrane lipoprotein [Ferruginibacter sp.]
MTNHKKSFLLIFAASSLMLSCTKDFQDLNTKPDQPPSTTIAPLMNGVIGTLVLPAQEQAAVHVDWMYPATQLAGESALSGYLLLNGSSDIWNNYYHALQNINLIQDKINGVTDQESMKNIQAILYVLRAYKTFRVTDVFGDIPFFNAGKTYTGDVSFYRPAYDDQKVIYDTLLSNLKWAVDNINTNSAAVTAAGNPYASLGAEETFFNNDLSKWQKFANSLLLRYSMQMVEKDAAAATPYITYALNKNLFIADGSDVGIWPATFGALDLANRPWSFGSGGTGYLRISSTMWNLVADGRDSSEVFDPRAFIFADTNAFGKWAPYTIGSPTADKVNPYDYSGPVSNKKGALYSPLNFFLVVDRHYIPELIMTAAETHFLKSEAYMRGLGVAQNTATAGTEYIAGVTASVTFWEFIAAHTNTAESPWSTAQPKNYTPAQLVPLLANPKVMFTADNAANLKKIYAQEWLDNFRQPWLAFNLWRRTAATPMDPAAVEDASHATFYRLPYPQDEAVNNTDNYNAQISKIGTNATNIKVWWMK